MTFADLGLSDQLLRAVEESGYSEPTPIQRGAIPSVLMGRDLVGIAQTGTGKTASFVLPMIDILAHGRSRALMPRSLILEPTRELAAQVSENFEKYGKYNKLSMALLIGGVQMGDQVKALEKGVDVLIATPGRLMDLFQRGKILLNGCELLVIDEADRMLDMGFIPDIEEICSKLPKSRQTLLFSATMPPPIQKLAAKFLNEPKRIEVARPATANVNIEQRLVDVRCRQEARSPSRHPPARGIQERDRLFQPQVDGSRAGDQPQALGLRGRPDPRRHGPVGPHRRVRPLQERRDQHPRRIRRRRARARRQRRQPRHQLRRAVAARRLHPPHRPHRPRGHDGHRDHARDARGCRGGCRDREADRPRRFRAATADEPAEAAAPSRAERAPKSASARAEARRAEAARGRAGAAKRPSGRAATSAKSIRERSPVVEDIEPDWNGPLPSFLSVGAL